MCNYSRSSEAWQPHKRQGHKLGIVRFGTTPRSGIILKQILPMYITTGYDPGESDVNKDRVPVGFDSAKCHGMRKCFLDDMMDAVMS